MANEPTTDSRLTELEVEFRSMSKQINDIAADMKKVLEFTSQLTLLNERQTHHRTDIDRAFTELRQVKDDIVADVHTVKVSVDSVKKDTSALRSECEGWINKGKGAWWAASILWAMIYVVFGVVLNSMYQDYKQIRTEVTTTSYQLKSHMERFSVDTPEKPK